MTCRFSALTDVVCKGSTLLRPRQSESKHDYTVCPGKGLKVHGGMGQDRYKG